MDSIFSRIAFLISFLFIIGFSSEICAQQALRINDDIGGSSGTATNVSESDNSMIYIVGGVVIAGVILYAIFRDKNDKKSDTDSTSTSESTLLRDGKSFVPRQDTDTYRDIPFDVYINAERVNSFTNERKYEIGLRFSL